MATKKMSALQRAYNALKKAKSRYCKGTTNKAMVNKAATRYIKAAVRKGQTRTEATKKANRVKHLGCKMNSSIAGTKKRKTTRRKKRA